ncbi:MAG: endonuclease/exonuclease/phosphatase family protein [FCB group bacterium]|nr:endonuclease/exonuclease/phosphatase family protein [FCB group bacterium]
MRTLILVAGLLLIVGCDPFGDHYSNIDEVLYYRAATLSPDTGQPDSLKVMTWNIKFGGGRIDFWFDCYGDRVLMTREEVTANLQALADYINYFAPDILLLQEVDINSKRCAYVDELQFLLDHTALNYAVYASQWRNQFVPSDGIGPIDSGNAILSRWELTRADRIALPLMTEQDPVTRYFYLKRNILKAHLSLPGEENLWVLDIHTAAYSHDGTKKKHLDRLKDELDKLSAEGAVFIAGGDFNTIPPGSVKMNDFPDSICEDEAFQADDYSEEVGAGWIADYYTDYHPAISLEMYGSAEGQQQQFYTHTVQGPPAGFWSRKLDYLFTNYPAGFRDGTVHQTDHGETSDQPMELSDHCPVTAVLEFE